MTDATDSQVFNLSSGEATWAGWYLGWDEAVTTTAVAYAVTGIYWNSATDLTVSSSNRIALGPVETVPVLLQPGQQGRFSVLRIVRWLVQNNGPFSSDVLLYWLKTSSQAFEQLDVAQDWGPDDAPEALPLPPGADEAGRLARQRELARSGKAWGRFVADGSGAIAAYRAGSRGFVPGTHGDIFPGPGQTAHDLELSAEQDAAIRRGPSAAARLFRVHVEEGRSVLRPR